MAYRKTASVDAMSTGFKIKLANLDPEGIGGFPKASEMMRNYDENIAALEAAQSHIYKLIEFCKAQRNALDAFDHDMPMEAVNRFQRHAETMYKQLPVELKW
jgi:hypothetical protein